MSTCQDICLISVWGLEDWNPHYGHHQLFPSSLQVWRDSFEMKNIKADLTELSDGALIPLTWLNPQLPSVWIQSPTQTCYWCSFRGLSTHPPSPWETARGSIVCDLWVGLMGTRSWAKWSRALPCPAQTCYSSVPSSWSGLLSTKEPLTRAERKLKIEVRVSGHSECVCALVKSWRTHLYAHWLWDTEEEGWASITALLRNLSLLKPFALVAI